MVEHQNDSESPLVSSLGTAFSGEGLHKDPPIHLLRRFRFPRLRLPNLRFFQVDSSVHFDASDMAPRRQVS